MEIAVKTIPGKPFLPGQSGNPSGRPKGLGLRIREQTREGEELIEFALEIMRGLTLANQALRFDAMMWLADRGWGKPLQITEVNSHVRIKLSWDNDAGD